MAIFETIDDLTSATGESLGPTEWQVISQEQIQVFADLTGDRQWIHVDEQRANRESPFGGPIAHGALTLALVPVMVASLVSVENTSMVINAGMRRVRFRSQVPAGARIRASGRLLETDEMAGGMLAVIQANVEVLGQSRPACVAEQMLVFHD